MLHRNPTRRTLLRHSVAAAGAMALSPWTTGCSRMRDDTEHTCDDAPKWRLGLDTYTVHRTLTAKDPELRRDLWWFLDRLDEHGLTGAQIDPSHFPGSDEATMKRLERYVETKGYYFEFGMWRCHLGEMNERLEQTAHLGGRAVRTFFCDQSTSVAEREKALVEYEPVLREAGKLADKHGVDIAIENHGDYTGAELAAFVERVGHPRVGACFDTGNSLFRKEDPLVCARALAPITFSMHLKDWHMRFGANGKPIYTEAVLGEGEVSLEKVLAIVAKHQPIVYASLETPVWPGENEAETVQRELDNYAKCAEAANRILKEMKLL